MAAILVLPILINRVFFNNCLETWHIWSHCMSRGVFECLHGIFYQYTGTYRVKQPNFCQGILFAGNDT